MFKEDFWGNKHRPYYRMAVDKHGGAISLAVVSCTVNTVQPLAHVH